jgi:hypothetical protein
MTFQKSALLPSSGKNSTLVEPLDKVCAIAGHHVLVKLLIYTLENKSFSEAVTGKMLLKIKWTIKK